MGLLGIIIENFRKSSLVIVVDVKATKDKFGPSGKFLVLKYFI